MKVLPFAALLLPLLAAAAAPAPEPEAGPPQRVTVPLSDPSRPATVKASSIHGSIAVDGYGGSEVIVDAVGRGERGEREEKVPPGAEGMHRIPNRALGLSISEDHNEVRVESMPWRGVSRNLHIQVPVHSSLHLSCINDCDLRVAGVDGEIELANVNGAIEARDVSGSVVAHTTNGNVRVALHRIDAGKPMAFSSLNGDIDVTFPADLRANVRVESGRGEVYSDFEIAGAGQPQAATPAPPATSEGQPGRRHRWAPDQGIRGTINGGGPEILLKTFNGNILIHRAKG